jgi:hypothetical protein
MPLRVAIENLLSFDLSRVERLQCQLGPPQTSCLAVDEPLSILKSQLTGTLQHFAFPSSKPCGETQLDG